MRPPFHALLVKSQDVTCRRLSQFFVSVESPHEIVRLQFSFGNAHEQQFLRGTGHDDNITKEPAINSDNRFGGGISETWAHHTREMQRSNPSAQRKKPKILGNILRIEVGLSDFDHLQLQTQDHLGSVAVNRRYGG